MKDSIKYSSASSKLILVGFDVQVDGLASFFSNNKKIPRPKSPENKKDERQKSPPKNDRKPSLSDDDDIKFVCETVPLKPRNLKKRGQNSKKWNHTPQTGLRNNFGGVNKDSDDILVYINNLPLDITKQEMERKFSPFGMTGYRLARDIESDEFLGYGFITLKHNRDFVQMVTCSDGDINDFDR